MHRESKWSAIISCLLFFAASALALEPLPAPPPSPTPPDTHPSRPIPTPSPTPTPSTATAEQSIPVVISYGNGTEARVQITNGLMEPVGIPSDQPVMVSVLLGSNIPGTPFQIGLYDGGQKAPALQIPKPPRPSASESDQDVASYVILADRTARFTFQSGRLLGLYRVVLAVGPQEYLLRFYAVKRRPSEQPLPPVNPGPLPGSTPPPNAPSP